MTPLLKSDHVIETGRLLLRPMRAEDAPALLSIFSDPKVMASFGGVLFDLPQMEGWVRRNLDHQNQYGYGLFSVIHRDTELLIGNCGLEHMEVEGSREAELGYDFRSDVWNRGYATEAARAVCEFALGEIGLARLISLIRVGNDASRRVSEKIGMACECEFERYGQRYWLYSLSRQAEEADDRTGHDR